MSNNNININSITNENIYFKPTGSGYNQVSGIGVGGSSWTFNYNYSNGIVSVTVGNVVYEESFYIVMQVYVII